MEKKIKRIEWVDLAKAICIICVIIAHSSFCNEYIRVIFSPFFLVLFFFISGYVYNDKYTFKELMKKNF